MAAFWFSGHPAPEVIDSRGMTERERRRVTWGHPVSMRTFAFFQMEPGFSFRGLMSRQAIETSGTWRPRAAWARGSRQMERTIGLHTHRRMARKSCLPAIVMEDLKTGHM